MKADCRIMVALLLVSSQMASAADSRYVDANTFGKTPTITFSRTRAVPLTALASQRGGTDTAAGSGIIGSVANTTATNVTTGANTVSDGAFVNASGLPMIVQNSGNNVVIQTSTIVNITVK